MRSIVLGLTLVLAPTSAYAQFDEKIADRLYQSAKALDDLLKAPDGGAPASLLKDAECVAVIPALKKAAFGFGGQYGRGTAVCKKDNGKGPWGPPSMIALSGGSFGFQLGGQSTDVVMLFMTPDSIQHLLKEKVTLGGDVAVAAGPKGRAVSAETSASMRAEILTYARSRGLFAGVSLKGLVLTPDKDANKSLYKQEIPAKDLLLTGNTAAPQPARKLIDLLTAASK